MDINQLEVLIAVAQEKSFSRAAERLHRTQPAISQAIRRLETEIGEPLFDPRANRQPVDHHFDGMPLVLVEVDLVAEFGQPPVDLGADETRAPHIAQLFFVFALAVAHDRASTWMRVASGHDMIRSTICWTLCCVISRPQL